MIALRVSSKLGARAQEVSQPSTDSNKVEVQIHPRSILIEQNEDHGVDN